jgi:DNA-binding CsgD family transcriptional regulator
MSISFASVFFSYLFYIKHPNPTLKYQVAYSIVLCAYLLIVLLRQYLWNVLPLNSFAHFFFTESLFLIWFSFMFYYFPRFFSSLIDSPLSKTAFWIIRVATVIPLLMLPLPLFLGMEAESQYAFLKKEIFYVLNTMQGLMICYYFAFLWIRYKKIENFLIKKVVKAILILTGIFLPGMIYDLFIRGKFGPHILVKGSIFCAFFLITWNMATLIFFSRFYHKKVDLSFISEAISPIFIKKFGITSRELEIIGLLMKEKTYSKISSELFISLRTVEKHVENIHKKVGVKQRAELISKIKQFSLV